MSASNSYEESEGITLNLNSKANTAWAESNENSHPSELITNRASSDPCNGKPEHHVNLDISQHANRRSSFLYKIDDTEGHHNARTGSRSSSFSTERIEEKIVTPFAQVMQTLQNIRDNFTILTKLQTDKRRGSLGGAAAAAHVVPRMFHTDKNYRKLALDTLQNFDWCLQQLESLQVHKSVSNMASNKFRKILAEELHHFSDASKSGSQVSKYLSSTFLDENGNDMDVPKEKGQSKAYRLSQFENKRNMRIPTMSRPVSRFGVVGVNEEAVSKCMAKIDQWGLEVFQVDRLTGGRPLTCIAYTIFQKRNFFDTFKVSEQTFLRYINTIENHYRKENYYHNNIHAADVTQSIHALLSGPVLSRLFTDLEIFTAIFAGAVHDVNHPGYNNQFLIHTMSELAIVYNDMSVLENHHLAMAFKLLQNEGCDIFANLSTKERQSVRKMAIDMVLATDMSKHMSLLAELRTMVDANKFSKVLSLSVTNYSDRIKVLQCCVHCADLSNPTKPLHLYKEWVRRILEECWYQGDKEKELGLPISPMMDRHNISIEKSQVGFIDFIVQPLWETWADLVSPDANKILDYLQENRDYFNSKILPSPSIQSHGKLDKNSENNNGANVKLSITDDSDNEKTSYNKQSDGSLAELDDSIDESCEAGLDNANANQGGPDMGYHLSHEVIQRLRRLSNDALSSKDGDEDTEEKKV